MSTRKKNSKNVYLPPGDPDLHEQIAKVMKEEGRSFSNLVVVALKHYFKLRNIGDNDSHQ